VNYTVTAVDTTAKGGTYPEGCLYVVVDFGGGWVEDFITAGLTADDDVLGTMRRIIEHHAEKAKHHGWSGDRRDPTIVLGGPDPHGLREMAKALLP
jgi:hypothetical protein